MYCIYASFLFYSLGNDIFSVAAGTEVEPALLWAQGMQGDVSNWRRLQESQPVPQDAQAEARTQRQKPSGLL